VRLAPKDIVAAQLLQTLTPPEQAAAAAPGDQTAPAPAPAEAARPTAPLEQSRLVGTWKAERPDGSSFELTLTGDSKFTWTFRQGDRTSTMQGNYTLGRETLLLEDAKGGTMVGQITPGDDGAFNFKMAGSPPEDPGLDFHS
jgi:hypothetical protein